MYARRFVIFTFYLVVPSFYVLLEFEATSRKAMDVCGKMGRMYLSIVDEYYSIEVTHNLRML